MRSDSPAFQARNRSVTAETIVVVEISLNSDNTQLAYLTSAQVSGLPSGSGITAFQESLISCSSTSQKLKVSDFSSTIGNIKAKSADDDSGNIASYFRSQFGIGRTTSNNRFRMYAGFSGLEFSDFALVQTQIVRNVEYNRGEIKFHCLDVQRDTKKSIFDTKTTILTANLTDSTTTVNVQSTNGFELVWHGTSWSDAPSTDAGYLILRDDDDNYEIMRWSSKTANSFTIAERGAMGTLARDWAALDQDGDSNELEVVEFIYLELPVVKLAYSILTGNLYGDAGKRLPDHWNLDINEQWVSTSQFVNVGADVWDAADDTKGRRCLFMGLDKEDGRKFINEQLMPMVGCFMPIAATGELGLRRISSVLSSSPYKALLTKENIQSISPIKYAQDEVQNQMQVDWSWDFVKESFRRASLFADSNSAVDNGYGWRDPKVVELKGMHGNIHSRDFIKGLFASFRDRYSSEPIYCKAKLIPGLNVLEVADTVRLTLDGWEDYTGSGYLDRTFEVQGVTVDWINGDVTVDLFGSTHDGTPLADDGEGYGAGYALSDALLTSEGTDIESTYAANVSRSGDLVTLDSDITFTGNPALTQSDGTPNPACILYCDGDLLIPPGVVLNFTGNMILAVTGFITINGSISGAGGGKAGGESGLWSGASRDPGYGPRVISVNNSYSQAVGGFMSPRMVPQGGIIDAATSAFGLRAVGVSGFESDGGIEATTTYTSVPELNLDLVSLAGLPSTLEGSGGPPGFGVYFGADSSLSLVGQGGTGGSGGGGLVTISRGMSFGVSGEVNLSGGDAANDNFFGYVPNGDPGGRGQAGSGCPGSPGAWVCLIDGGDSTPPLISDAVYKANCGAPSFKTQNLMPFKTTSYFDGAPFAGDNPLEDRNNSYDAMSGFDLPTFTQVENFWQAYHRVQFLVPATVPPGEEAPADTVAPNVTAIALTENTNTPQSPAGNLSSIDVLVTPPASTAYAYSRVYVRLQGTTAWNRLEFAAEDETSFTVQSNGATWEVQARSVSVAGVENDSGPIQTITVTNKGASANYALEIGYDENDETLIRVIDLNDSNAVVGSVSGGGIAGKVVAGAGSTGYGNYDDKPASLSDVNSGEGTKLGGIQSGADQTQTALDDEVTTTGGVVLSTNGAVRTSGKSDPDDGNPGVILGNISGDQVLYAGDGELDFIRYVEGEGLSVGPSVSFEGFSNAFDDDLYLTFNRQFSDLYSEQGGTGEVTHNYTFAGNNLVLECTTSATASQYNLLRLKGASPVAQSYFSNGVILNVGVARYGTSSDSNVATYIVVGSISQGVGASNNFAGFVLRGESIYGITKNGTSGNSTESLLGSFSGLNNAKRLKMYTPDGANYYFYLDGVLASTITTNVPDDYFATNYVAHMMEAEGAVATFTRVGVGELKMWNGR